jgi:hypothetical protein
LLTFSKLRELVTICSGLQKHFVTIEHRRVGHRIRRFGNEQK